MAGEHAACVLHAHAPLEHRLRQVAEDGGHGKQRGERDDQRRLQAKAEEVVEQHHGGEATGEPAQRPLDGLARADARRQLATADCAADEVGGGIDGEGAEDGQVDEVPALRQLAQ